MGILEFTSGENLVMIKFPKATPCWLIWEHIITTTCNKRFLRCVDTTKEMMECHLESLKRDFPNHKFEVEERVTNHCYGKDILSVAGIAYK